MDANELRELVLDAIEFVGNNEIESVSVYAVIDSDGTYAQARATDYEGITLTVTERIGGAE